MVSRQQTRVAAARAERSHRTTKRRSVTGPGGRSLTFADTPAGYRDDAYWRGGDLYLLTGTTQLEVYSRGGHDQQTAAVVLPKLASRRSERQAEPSQKFDRNRCLHGRLELRRHELRKNVRSR